MRKSLIPVLSAALLLTLNSCSYKEHLFLPVEGTTWTLKIDDVTTWVCFHNSDSASLLQHNAALGRVQADHGTYTADGHVLTVKTEYASEYTINRTFFNLKRFNKNDNYTQISPCSYPTLAGSVWSTPIHGDLHIAYFLSDTECVDILYANLTRVDGSAPYGWSGVRNSAKISGNTVEAGGLSATLYKGIMTSGVYALQIVDDPIEEEEGTSGLKGTVWTYNNTGHPADIPIAYIFNGKDSFVRISGLYAGTVSDSRISPIIFDIASGTYSESGGTLTLTVGENKESCPISGSSFTLSERTFNKLSY